MLESLPIMFGMSCDPVFMPVVSLVLGSCALVLGCLGWHEVKGMGRRWGNRHERRGPQGIAVLVRGLGFRSELSLASVTASSDIRTAAAPRMDACLRKSPVSQSRATHRLEGIHAIALLRNRTRMA